MLGEGRALQHSVRGGWEFEVQRVKHDHVIVVVVSNYVGCPKADTLDNDVGAISDLKDVIKGPTTQISLRGICVWAGVCLALWQDEAEGSCTRNISSGKIL